MSIAQHPLKLLIADDHTSFRRLVKGLFGSSSTQIIECADGTEAVASYREHHPDWVLMDFEMEPMDGLAATRTIVAQYPEAKVILITYRDDDDIRLAAKEAGARYFFPKDHLTEVQALIYRPASSHR